MFGSDEVQKRRMTDVRVGDDVQFRDRFWVTVTDKNISRFGDVELSVVTKNGKPGVISGPPGQIRPVRDMFAPNTTPTPAVATTGRATMSIEMIKSALSASVQDIQQAAARTSSSVDELEQVTSTLNSILAGSSAAPQDALAALLAAGEALDTARAALAGAADGLERYSAQL